MKQFAITIAFLQVAFSGALRIANDDEWEQPVAFSSAQRIANDEERPSKHAPFDAEKDLAMVFSMGKVGSTSIWKALSAVMGKESSEYGNKVQDSYKRNFKTHQVGVAEDFIAKAPEGSKIWVFTSVRQPFTRLISGFFERIESQALIPRDKVFTMAMTDYHKEFVGKIQPPTRFIRNQLGAVTGLNFLEDPNCAENLAKRGRLIWSNKKNGKTINVVLLRLEDHDRWDASLSEEIPGWKTPALSGQNSSQTWYAPKYQEFMRTFSFEQKMVDKYLNDDAMHFYTPEERAAFIKQATSSREQQWIQQEPKSFAKLPGEANFEISTKINGKAYLMYDLKGDTEPELEYDNPDYYYGPE